MLKRKRAVKTGPILLCLALILELMDKKDSKRSFKSMALASNSLTSVSQREVGRTLIGFSDLNAAFGGSRYSV